MTLRKLRRQLVIELTTGLGVDAANRVYERALIRARQRACVRVVFYHATPALHADQFRRQLAWLQTQFEAIDFAAFKRRFESPIVSAFGRPAVLVTFDDGFVSNYDVAAPVLEEFGMRGVFFVVPAFSLAEGNESRAFFASHFTARGKTYERGMTPHEICDLADRGHTIGNHTFSHARLSLTPDAEYRHEIDDAADAVESWIGRPVEAFAWTYQWDAIAAAAHRLAAERHRYCFSPCAGLVDPQVDSSRLVWRTNAEVDRRFREFRFQCSGLADYVSASRRLALARRVATAARAMRNSWARA